MKKLENVARVERERESYILENKNVGLLSDFANISNINNNEIDFIDKCSKAMCFSGS